MFFEISGAKEYGVDFEQSDEFFDCNSIAFLGSFFEVTGPEFCDGGFEFVPGIASLAPSLRESFFSGFTKLESSVDLVVEMFFLGGVFRDFGSGE